eukprot:PhM_4_TR12415/c0_g1_i1/m.5164
MFIRSRLRRCVPPSFPVTSTSHLSSKPSPLNVFTAFTRSTHDHAGDVLRDTIARHGENATKLQLGVVNLAAPAYTEDAPVIANLKPMSSSSSSQTSADDDVAGVNTYSCHLCKKAFKIVGQLQAHYLDKHGMEAPAAALAGNAPATQSSSPFGAPSTTASPLAASALFGSGGLGGFEGSVTGFNAGFGNDGSGASAAPAASGKFQCQLCGKSFRLQDALNYHMTLAHGQQAAPSSSGASSNPFGGGAVSSIVSTRKLAFGEITPAPGFDPPPEDEESTSGSGAQVDLDPYTTELLPRPIPRAHVHIASMLASVGVFIGAVVGDVQSGFVFEDPCVQFRLRTEDMDGEDFGEALTVRCFGRRAVDEMTLRESVDTSYSHDVVGGDANIKDTATVVVIGALKLVPYYDPQAKCFYHCPVVQVCPPFGSVHFVKAAPLKVVEEEEDTSAMDEAARADL